jgi:hypothetical protein
MVACTAIGGNAFAHTVWARSARHRAALTATNTREPRPGVLRSSARQQHSLQIYASQRSSSTDVSFGVFQLRPLASDALPQPLTRHTSVLDSRFALRAGDALVWIFKPGPCSETPPTAPALCAPPAHTIDAQTYCFAIQQPRAASQGCTSAAGLARRGTSMSCCVTPNLVIGIVPDFVKRVRFDGHDVPIVNNAFVFQDTGPIPRPVLIRTSD